MRSAAAASATAVVLVATGSGGGSSKNDTAKASGTPTASSTSKAAPVVQNPLPKTVKNSTALRRNVSLASCSASAGGWSASGPATNPSKKTATYTITVFFTTNKATVQDYSSTTVSVEPGKTTPWNASIAFKASTPTLCVLRGVA